MKELSDKDAIKVIDDWMNEDWAVRFNRLKVFGHYEDIVALVARKAESEIKRQIVEMLKEQQGHGAAGFYNQILIQTLELELKAEVE